MLLLFIAIDATQPFVHDFSNVEPCNAAPQKGKQQRTAVRRALTQGDSLFLDIRTRVELDGTQQPFEIIIEAMRHP